MKRKKLLFLLFFALALLSLGSCTPLTPVPKDINAVIGEIENNVTVKHRQDTSFHAAFVNEEISVQEQIKTGEDSRARVDLSSGTVIRIAPHSLFTLESNYEEKQSLLTKLTVEAGRVWIVLKGGSLEVETPAGVAGVRGSYMSTGYDSESGTVRITCLEGHCAAENEAGTVEFGAGEAADLPADGGAPQKGLMTAEEFQEWAENVPEASAVLQLPTPSPTPTETPTPQPSLTPVAKNSSCTVLSTYLYIRSCAAITCAPLGYAEKDTQLPLYTDEKEAEGWLSVEYEGETGWVNDNYCDSNTNTSKKDK